jgi:hypothetical protein
VDVHDGRIEPVQVHERERVEERGEGWDLAFSAQLAYPGSPGAPCAGREVTMPRPSRTIGNQLQRFRNGLQSLESKASEFKHIASDMKAFAKTIEDIVTADAEQERAKLVLAKATAKVNGLMKGAEATHASFKRSWQARYPPNTHEGKSFDAPKQGKLAKPRSKKGKGTP